MSGFLFIGGTTGHVLLLFSFMRSEFFSTFSTFLDRRHALRVICFCFLPGSEDVIFCQKIISARQIRFHLCPISLQVCKFTFRSGSATDFNFFGQCLYAQVIQECEVCGGQNLQIVRCHMTLTKNDKPLSLPMLAVVAYLISLAVPSRARHHPRCR